MRMAFNRSPDVTVGQSIDMPSAELIESTPSLRQASLDVALRYGGKLTRHALEAIQLGGDRSNIIVDTKVHYLMKGWCPSIPGWHTDGVPKGAIC